MNGTRFTIRKTDQGRYLTFTPLGSHISGTAHKTVDAATAEITGWCAGWNASIDREPIRSWGWDIQTEIEEATNGN